MRHGLNLKFICPVCGQVSDGRVIQEVTNNIKRTTIETDDRYVENPFDIATARLGCTPYCKKCGVRQDPKEKLFHVDDSLGTVVAKFNQLGYRTEYSCGGHLRVNCDGISFSSPYLMFAPDMKANRQIFAAVQHIKNLQPDIYSRFEAEASIYNKRTYARDIISREQFRTHPKVQITLKLTQEEDDKICEIIKSCITEDQRIDRKKYRIVFNKIYDLLNSYVVFLWTVAYQLPERRVLK